MNLLQACYALFRREPALPRAVQYLYLALALALLSLILATTTLADSGSGARSSDSHSVAPGAAIGRPSPTDFPSADDRARAAVSTRGGFRSPLASPQAAFIEAAGSAAQVSQAATGVPASVVIAQAILESNWGRSTIQGANNYFGIKADPGSGPDGVVWAQTREFVHGAWITISAPFRVYGSMAESFADHGRFLAENKRYAAAFQYKDDPRAFAEMLQQAGYATDPTYAQKLIGLMDKYDLYQFDLAAAPADRQGDGSTQQGAG